MAGRAGDLEDKAAEARAFLGALVTLQLATVSPEGTPEASYAPFVRLEDNYFYVYLSELARHTANLSATARASVLLIEDESKTAEPFARRRLTFTCRARLVERESEQWRTVMGVFEGKFGKVMELIRPLTDFKLFALAPERGVYVRGFAQAYRIEGAALEDLRHINDVGHRRG